MPVLQQLSLAASKISRILVFITYGLHGYLLVSPDTERVSSKIIFSLEAKQNDLSEKL